MTHNEDKSKSESIEEEKKENKRRKDETSCFANVKILCSVLVHDAVGCRPALDFIGKRCAVLCMGWVVYQDFLKKPTTSVWNFCYIN